MSQLSPAQNEPLPATVVDLFQPPATSVGQFSWREPLSILLLVILGDLTIYWGQGYFGVATFLLLSPIFALIALPRIHWSRAFWLMAVVVILWSLRIAWYGSILRTLSALITLAGLGVLAHGGRCDIRAIALLPAQALPAGLVSLDRLFRNHRFQVSLPVAKLLGIGIPLIAIVVFGGLFVLANPNISEMFGRQLQHFTTWLQGFFGQFEMRLGEMVFWGFAALISAGLIRPNVDLSWFHEGEDHTRVVDESKQSEAALFAAFRNTLFAVIGLFVVYLTYEFATLWFREFPEGFYYAGYAHQGAFWLTAALAAATGLLSLVFRGPILNDPRVDSLRRLAWVWSVLNGLLALSVYNRLSIYVGFNGLTHMRIVGYFGTTAVVAGFAIVVWRIARDYDFVWLVTRQVWALAITIMVYAFLPVDGIAVTYNARRILAGDSTAAMQIGVQSLDLEGALALPPLLESDDPEVRNGVRALLAERYHRLAERRLSNREKGWTTWQAADEYAWKKLDALKAELVAFEDPKKRAEALEQFREYAYQWY